MKNKLGLTACLCLALMAGAIGFGYFYVQHAFAEENGAENTAEAVNTLSEKELAEQTYKADEITTNLRDGSYIVLGFQILTTNKDTATELKNRSFQLNDYIISELSNMSSSQAGSNKTITQLKKKMMHFLNQSLQKGEVQEIYISKKLIQ